METLASVLKHLARFCLGAAFIFLVSGLIDTWMTRGAMWLWPCCGQISSMYWCLLCRLPLACCS